MSRFARPAAAALTAAVLVFSPIVVTTPAYAANFPVTITADSGLGSLRDAIDDANANPGPDTIIFDGSLNGQTILLDSVIVVTETLTIIGPGSALLTIERNAPFDMDLLAFQPAAIDNDFSISGLTLQGDGVLGGSGIIVNNNDEEPRSVVVDDVVITDMVTAINGAGMNVNVMSGSLTITDSVFRRNVSGANGGAVHAFNVGGQVTITDSEFSSNEATLGGGAVSINGAADVTVQGSSFSSNEAGASGGGLVVSTGGGLVIERSSFTSNDGEVGGGVFAAPLSDSSRITGSTFDSNTSFQAGGGVYIQEALADVTVSESLFDSNTALLSGQGGSYGGGLYVGTVRNDGSLLVDSSTFTNHRLDPGLFINGSGLGVAVQEVAAGSAVQIINSTFSERAQAQGAAIYLGELATGSTSTIAHSTVVGEFALRVLSNLGTVNLRHSILVGGAVMGGGQAVSGLGSPLSMAWSLINGPIVPEITNDGGNQFSTDPQLGDLADNGGPTPTMLPNAASPALNAGDPNIVGAPVFDQRGTGFDRVLQGRIDLGAVETDAELAATGTDQVAGLLVGSLALLVLGAALTVFRRRTA